MLIDSTSKNMRTNAHNKVSMIKQRNLKIQMKPEEPIVGAKPIKEFNDSRIIIIHYINISRDQRKSLNYHNVFASIELFIC